MNDSTNLAPGDVIYQDNARSTNAQAVGQDNQLHGVQLVYNQGGDIIYQEDPRSNNAMARGSDGEYHRVQLVYVVGSGAVPKLGRYLSTWNCATGLPETNPETDPYEYTTGDYYIVGTVASSGETNYRPNGSSYVIGQASTTVESSSIGINDTYLYDGTNWTLLKTSTTVTSVNGQVGDVTVQETLVNQQNIKSVNGNSLLGSGNLELTQLLTYPVSWPTTSTTSTKAFCDAVAADTSAVVGKMYLGEVRWSDLPANIVNGEVKVEIMDGTTASDKVIVLTLTSGNVTPYMWQYVYWNGGSNVSGWKTWLSTNGGTMSGAIDFTGSGSYTMRMGASATNTTALEFTSDYAGGINPIIMDFGNNTIMNYADNTGSLGQPSYRWGRVCTTTLNNGNTIDVPTVAGSMAIQVSSMPTASSSLEDQIYQFVGTTDSTYTNGYFYKCVSDGQNPATYSWVQTNVQPAPSGLPSQTGQSGKFLTTDGTDASWSDKPLVNTATDSTSVGVCGTVGANVRSVCVGTGAKVENMWGIAVGPVAKTQGARSVAIGTEPSVSGQQSICLTATSPTISGSYSIGIISRIMTSSSLSANNTIVIGAVYNLQGLDDNSFYVGLDALNQTSTFKLLASDGTIPTDRLTKVNTTITLAAANWSSNTQTVNVTGMTATGVVFPSPDPADQSAYTGAGILCTAQGSGTLTFTCTSVPSADIDVNVVML